jgi:predicted kinase
MPKGTLILLCGLPGSGKTTLAHVLERERNAVRLCPDEWIMDLLENPKDIPEMDRLRHPVEQLQWRLAQDLLRRGLTVILENGFWPRWERDRYRDRARELGADVELHFLNVPLETRWHRIEARNANAKTDPSVIIIPYDDLASWDEKFDSPTEEEGRTYARYTVYDRKSSSAR